MRSTTRWPWGRIVAAAFFAAGVAVAVDVHTPSEVPWQTVTLQGLPAARADDLVLQEESPGVTWASKGYAIYRSSGGEPFEKVFTVVPRFGEAWAGFSRTLRRRFGYQELVEVLPVRPELLVVFAGGDVYRVDLSTGTQERTHRLRYFGRGRGRGVMAHGLTRDAAGSLYYGEYTTAPRSEPVPIGIWRSDDEGRRWTLAFEFAPGSVRHVHGVQWDPVGGGIWVGTGDANEASRVGYSLDQARSFVWVGEGSQEYRVCSVLFLAGSVAWGMDADRSPNHALRWSRADGALERVPGGLPGPTFFAQPVTGTGGLLGLAELDAAVFWLGVRGPAQKLLQWTLPRPARRGPHPGVRLARGSPSNPAFVQVNPLRTAEDEAAVYRIEVGELLGRIQDQPGLI